ALIVSALFLTSYLTYHIVVRHGEPTRFASRVPADTPGWVFTLYYVLLATHTLLAVPTAPLALVTAYLGWRARFRRDVRPAGPGRGLPRWARALGRARAARPLGPAGVAVRVGDRRRRLLDVVPSLSVALSPA